jgi:putative ABC transport system permease protein
MLVAAEMGLRTGVSPAAVALGLVLAAGTGLLAGVAPARRAALLEPAVALR